MSETSRDSALIMGIMRSNEKFSQGYMSNALATSWQANLFCELVKITAMSSVPDGVNPDGSQRMRWSTIDECISRSTVIVERAVAMMIAKQWVAPMPTLDDLREESHAAPGFVRTSNGQADKGSAALPGAGDTAPSDS